MIEPTPQQPQPTILPSASPASPDQRRWATAAAIGFGVSFGVAVVILLFTGELAGSTIVGLAAGIIVAGRWLPARTGAMWVGIGLLVAAVQMGVGLLLTLFSV